MNEFSHIRLIVGFVLSLSMAQLLRGIAKLIVQPAKYRLYWVHLLWVFYMFLNLIYFWWWEYRLHQLSTWTFTVYVLIITYILLFYLCCHLLLPDDMGSYSDFKTYYYARLQWFFGILSVTFILDVADTLLKPQPNSYALERGYLVCTAIQVIVCLMAIRIKDERYHAGLALASIGYTIAWISRQYLIM